MHQLPPGQLGKWAQQMAKEYGEMFSIKIGGQRWVFLTSSRTIKDLLEKRAAVKPLPGCGLIVDLQFQTADAHAWRYDVRWKKDSIDAIQ